MLKGTKNCLNLHDSSFIMFFHPSWGNCVGKCLCWWYLFIKSLTADYKCSLRNRENLPQPIQMQLSKKRKTFSEFFTPFLKSTSIFEYFDEKDDPHRLYISEITECERRGKINVQKSPFENILRQLTCLNLQCSQTLLEYFFIILRETDFENVSLSNIWNLRAVC